MEDAFKDQEMYKINSYYIINNENFLFQEQ